ncbi:MAG: hypothetical protein HC797_05670, partial [Anaerolineales bacterium]|nr:hypothetical protein [Anaerolineales bacterium]
MIQPENKSGATTTGIIIGVLALLCCVCVIALGAAGYIFYTTIPSDITNLPVFTETEPTVEPEIIRLPVDSFSNETLQVLQTSIVPVNNPRELACRLNGKCNIPEVMATSALPRVVGDKDNFWVHNVDSNENNQIQATLQYVTPHVYFWVQDGIDTNKNEIAALSEEFEKKFTPPPVSSLAVNGVLALTAMNIFIFYIPEVWASQLL